MAIKTKPEEPEEPDPFRDFSLAELWTYIFKTQGADALRSHFSDFANALRSHFSDFDDDEVRQVLREHDLEDIQLERELLIDIGDELSLLGLNKCAAVVFEEAKRRPSRFDRLREWGSEERWLKHIEREQKHWRRQRRYFLATGKRWKGSMIPPQILASLPAEQ